MIRVIGIFVHDVHRAAGAASRAACSGGRGRALSAAACARYREAERRDPPPHGPRRPRTRAAKRGGAEPWPQVHPRHSARGARRGGQAPVSDARRPRAGGTLGVDRVPWASTNILMHRLDGMHTPAHARAHYGTSYLGTDGRGGTVRSCEQPDRPVATRARGRGRKRGDRKDHLQT